MKRNIVAFILIASILYPLLIPFGIIFGAVLTSEFFEIGVIFSPFYIYMVAYCAAKLVEEGEMTKNES